MLNTHVVHEDQSSCASKEEPSSPVTPTETGDSSREDHAHSDKEKEVVLVLPSNDLVPGQIRNVGNTDLASRFDNHPTDMRPPETLVSRVRVELGVGISVVSSVSTRPPFD